MTSATSSTPHERSRTVERLERLAILAGVCLPVPLFAATGLSIPLPSVVERLAAALVPWAEAATISQTSLAAGPGGSIVFAPGEGAADVAAPSLEPTQATRPAKGRRTKRSRVESVGPVPGDRADTAPEPRGAEPGPGPTTAAPPPGESSPEQPASGASDPSGAATDGGAAPEPGGESQPKPSEGGTEPEPSGDTNPPPDDPKPVTAPVEGAVDDVVDTLEPVVDDVEEAADDPVGTVGGAVSDPVGTVGGLVPRLGG